MNDAILMRLRHALGETAVIQDAGGLPRATPDSAEGIAHVCGLAHDQGWRIRVEGMGSWMPPDAGRLALSTRGRSRIVDIATAIGGHGGGGGSLGVLQLGLGLKWPGSRSIPAADRRWLIVATAPPVATPRMRSVKAHPGRPIVTGRARIIKAGGSVVKNVGGMIHQSCRSAD